MNYIIKNVTKETVRYPDSLFFYVECAEKIKINTEIKKKRENRRINKKTRVYIRISIS